MTLSNKIAQELEVELSRIGGQLSNVPYATTQRDLNILEQRLLGELRSSSDVAIVGLIKRAILAERFHFAHAVQRPFRECAKLFEQFVEIGFKSDVNMIAAYRAHAERLANERRPDEAVMLLLSLKQQLVDSTDREVGRLLPSVDIMIARLRG